MKRKYIAPLTLVVFLLFISCQKAAFIDNPENCINQIEKVGETLNAYMQDPSVNNCKAYTSALKSYLSADACFGNIFFEAYKRQLEEEDECK